MAQPPKFPPRKPAGQKSGPRRSAAPTDGAPRADRSKAGQFKQRATDGDKPRGKPGRARPDKSGELVSPPKSGSPRSRAFKDRVQRPDAPTADPRKRESGARSDHSKPRPPRSENRERPPKADAPYSATGRPGASRSDRPDPRSDARPSRSAPYRDGPKPEASYSGTGRRGASRPTRPDVRAETRPAKPPFRDKPPKAEAAPAAPRKPAASRSESRNPDVPRPAPRTFARPRPAFAKPGPARVGKPKTEPEQYRAPKSNKEPQRIAKLLARAGVASRRDIERMIAEGRITRDGVVLDTPATIVTSLQGILVDGHAVKPAEPTKLYCYHKAPGVLTAERDFKGRPTIYDRMPEGLPRVMPVGRLDLNTEGLLLLTTDGEFKRQLELPSTGIPRVYRARAYGNVTQAQLEDLIDGIEIEGVLYGSIDANIERRTGANVWIEMKLAEGKNREVRRVLEHLGLQVSRLIRTAYGPFVLGDLPANSADEITQHDVVAFRKTLK